MQKLVHLFPVLLEAWKSRDIVLGNNTFHLGLAELDDALAQIAEVLEQIVVVGIDKFPFEKSAYVITMGLTVAGLARLTPI